jgi:epoxide hydrolase 4
MAALPAIQTGLYCEVQPGIRLHYAFCEGAAPRATVVMLHGFPEYWGAWSDVMPLLASQGFRVIAPDQRGYNLSSKPQDVASYRAGALMADIRGLIHHLEGAESSVFLVAHDWGGAIGWALASQLPELVKRLVIINSPHAIPFWRALSSDLAQQQASQYMNWLRKPGCEQPLLQNDFARLDDFFLNMSGAKWFAGEVREAYHAAWGQPGAMTGMVNWYRASPLYPPTADDAGAAKLKLDPRQFMVHRPTRVIWAQDDIALLPILLEGLPELVPGMELIEVPGATHWIAHEKAPEVAHWIGEFFLRHDA